MTSATPPAILQTLVERFAKAFADFMIEVKKAVQEAAASPELCAAPALLTWQTQALPLLEQQEASVQKGAAQFQAGDTETILASADEAIGLDKELDGFPLDFAGPAHTEKLETLKVAVVGAAYHLRKAARSR